ncbi:MAG: serine/threonine-protein kinase [Bryobacterales bacterium]|nr:serine/threonine-protein kinase [Bryobacterales bacterium]
MALVRGSLDSRFELAGIVAESSAGTVYLARTRDSRDLVCLQFVGWRHSTPVQRQRFVYEAREASRIAHPNLLPVRDVLEGDDGMLVVYGYEPCQTLASMLANGALPVKQASAFSMQIADALEATSRLGILHGYVDPTSILITESGLAKLMGFGCARLRAIEDDAQRLAPGLAGDAAAALERTHLRRVAYQAPECLQGIAADSRSEVFSLGCVLYEMLSGKRAFARRTGALTMRAVIEQPPRPISEVASGVPQELAGVLRRCLRKQPDRRYQHLLDLKIELQNFREEMEFAEIIESVQPARLRRRWRFLALVPVLWACVYFGVPQILLQYIRPRGLPSPQLRKVTDGIGLTTDPYVSADGRTLVYASDRDNAGLDIYLRHLEPQGGEEEVRRLTRDSADEREPALSPDGRTVAFRSDRLAGGIYTAPADGSAAPRWIANQGRRPRYSPDGKWIAFWARTLRAEELGSVYVIPAEGGAPRQVVPEFHTALLPIWSPDGEYLLFLGARKKGDWLEFWIVPREGGEPATIGSYRVVRRWFLTQMAPDAWVNDSLYFTGTVKEKTGLWRIHLPLATRRVDSDSLPLFQDSPHDGGATVSSDGRIYFARLTDSIQLWSLPLDANRGRVQGELSRFFADDGASVRPSLSEDGRLLAYTSSKGGKQNVWLRDLLLGEETRITDNPHNFFTPTGVLSADGQWLAFTRYEKGRTIIFARATETGEETRLCDVCETPRDWSRDASHLLYVRSARNYSIGMVERGTGANTILVQSDRVPLLSPRFAPDNRWIAFHALESPDLRKVFAQAFAGTSSAQERAWVAVTSGRILDRGAQWSPDGNLLYFMSERDGRRNIYAQAVDPATKKPRGEPFVVYGNRATQRSLLNVPRGLAEMVVLKDKLIFTMGEYTGNIYEATYPQ